MNQLWAGDRWLLHTLSYAIDVTTTMSNLAELILSWSGFQHHAGTAKRCPNTYDVDTKDGQHIWYWSCIAKEGEICGHISQIARNNLIHVVMCGLGFQVLTAQVMVRPSPSLMRAQPGPGFGLGYGFQGSCWILCRYMWTSALDNDICSKDLNPSPSHHQTLDCHLLL